MAGLCGVGEQNDFILLLDILGDSGMSGRVGLAASVAQSPLDSDHLRVVRLLT